MREHRKVLRRFEFILCLSCTWIVAGFALQCDAASPRFTPVDTSRVMGSPSPLPLEVECVYPQLQFNRPLEFTFAPDGSNRCFVVEQEGKVFVFENDPDVARAELFLDITDVVSREGNEEGLLGFAFHPRYRETGEFFVYYSTKPRASVISRFHVSEESPNRALRNSEEEILRIEQPFGNHNGGSIRFGPSGYLYIGLGDGGSAHDPMGNGQNLKTLLGSILRIDIDHKDPGKAYAIPKDNPFVGRGASARGEIWAYGLRNVWRLAFDRETGDLWAGDVGQNRYEEVNLITRGGNYGWNVREGFHPFQPDATQTGKMLIDPLTEYFHSEGLSITGGIVYRGARLRDYHGAYFYADYVTGQVWMLQRDGDRTVENRKVARTGLAISAFGEDAQGEMVITAFDGHLYRFRERKRAPAVNVFPQTLSETGLFQSVETLAPVEGVIPYDVNVPLWSDRAAKSRFMALPSRASVRFDARQTWAFPVGTVFIKNFFLDLDRVAQSDRRRLETRLLVHSEEGWQGYTYIWNDDQTEADLADAATTRTFDVKTASGMTKQSWYFPSRSDCIACHARSVNFVLGANTRQMNREYPFGVDCKNQIQVLESMGIFESELPAKPADLEAYPRADASFEKQARAYLDVHCAGCHGPGGILGTRPDLSYHAPLAKMALLNRNPRQGWVGPDGSKLVLPGDPSHSEILSRMSIRGDRQMPPVGTNVADPRGIELMRKWIESL